MLFVTPGQLFFDKYKSSYVPLLITKGVVAKHDFIAENSTVPTPQIDAIAQ